MYSRDYLAHHGIKGMKWGVRKKRQSGVFGKKKKEKNVSPEVEKDRKRVDNMLKVTNKMDQDPNIPKKKLYETACKMRDEIRTDPKSMKKARIICNNIYGEYELFITGVYDEKDFINE